ncbi:MAG: GntR family transcriptional regulator [Martelella sp.]|uniref:GntR family transcriptional regulator n=1 Tax=unclassified Martelella TaxID=2629616 RepID=UPI000C4E3436|nr:GntR family transcriptional regulator [Martelella sp.]MAU21719.1 GntR family transcriptional regulator [Martelella sp.]|tara:strand:+ start:239 stop:895 length:657 start_codon:yes stop_codon:yes gene_type:complete
MTTEPATGRDRLAQIHDIIRERIMMLDYPPGEKLSEVALANEFGVSRTPLRRVLAGLEDEGLLRSVHGVGTIVTDVDLEELAQVYRLRMELVVLIAHLDPAPLTVETVADFRALHERALALRQTPAPRDFAALDRDMFLAINRLSLNQPLRETGERLYFRTARIWLQAITASAVDFENEAEIYCRETAEILAAIETGQIDALCHLRRAHIAMSFERMR